MFSATRVKAALLSEKMKNRGDIYMVTYNREKTGALLSSLRQKKGFSQEHMADLLHVSYRTLRRWESGEATPSMEDIVNYCNFFSISLEEFFKGEVSFTEKIKRTVDKSAHRISEKWPVFRGHQARRIYYGICILLFTIFIALGIYYFAWYIGIMSTTGQTRQFYLSAFLASILLSLCFRILSIVLDEPV